MAKSRDLRVDYSCLQAAKNAARNGHKLNGLETETHSDSDYGCGCDCDSWLWNIGGCDDEWHLAKGE